MMGLRFPSLVAPAPSVGPKRLVDPQATVLLAVLAVPADSFHSFAQPPY